MKKISMCMCCLLMLSSCGEKEQQTTQNPVNFLFATPLSNHTLWLQAKDGMEAACEELGVYCDWKGPTSIDTKEMEDVINTGILQGSDGIITQGVINPALIAKGKEEDIPFVLVDSDIQGTDPLAAITKDFTQQAELLLADIEKTLGKDKKLYIGMQVSDLRFDLAKGQVEAVNKVFQNHPGGFEILATTESKSDKLQAREQWEKALDEKMNVALNFAGESVAGCVEAIDLLSLQDDLIVYGVDDMEDTIDLIKQGKIKGSIVTSFYKFGYDAIHILYDYVVHHKVPATSKIAAEILLVNKDNVTTYKDKEAK